VKLIGCEYMRNCSVSQVLFDLFHAGATLSGFVKTGETYTKIHGNYVLGGVTRGFLAREVED
jgi:hypothetical protein